MKPELPTANARFETGLGSIVTFSANQYSTEQMLEFQRRTIEACVKICELNEGNQIGAWGSGFDRGCKSCAEEIKEMLK